MDRLFLDANVLFSAAFKADARVSRLWRLNNVVLYSSRYALEEARFNLEEEGQLHRLMALAQNLHYVEASGRNLPRGITLPGKDAPILSAAIAARATHLLTGDVRHFGLYFRRTIVGVLILPPGDYLRTSGR